MFRSIEIDANYLPMDLPMRSLAIPNKSEQSLSRVESFQNPIVDLLWCWNHSLSTLIRQHIFI